MYNQPFEIFLYIIFGMFLLMGCTNILLYIKEHILVKTNSPMSIHLLIGVSLLLIGGTVLIDLI
jgi:hypothetical protein